MKAGHIERRWGRELLGGAAGLAAPTSNSGDNIFSDGTQTEMATLAGDPATGYDGADLTISVSA